MSERSPYLPVRARLEDVREESATIRTVVLAPEEEIRFRTGQFVELAVPGAGEAPFTPSSNPRRAERMEVTILRAGRVTAAIHALAPGAEIGVRGPYGNGYDLGALAGKDLAIIGGGVGLAPLRSLILEILEEPERFGAIRIRFGAREPAEMIFRDEIARWREHPRVDLALTVDKAEEGWKDGVGVVTTILEDVAPNPERTEAIVCGPPVMLKFATLKLLELGIAARSIHLSMERNMSCGVGHCGHCRIGRYYVCVDGPVLTYDKIQGEVDAWQ
ncbi:MAG: FAD/NAD(P)-binding protein [Planctomycetes bacterium]|nr:FAD/NAD(P)-binding protein [Planctomycetota bacterium]